MKKFFSPIFAIFILALIACEPKLSGPVLIEKSIEFHDPMGEWNSLEKIFYFTDSRPGNARRNYEVHLNNNNSYFRYINFEEELIYEVSGQTCLSADPKSDSCQRALTLRDYYTFLWGLPMKLSDAETSIENEFSRDSIEGVEAYVVKVPYEKDIWYIYLHPETFQMLAYKFYKEEGKGVGEIILLMDEIIVDNMKIPAERAWYRTENQEYLGTDILLRTSDFDQ